MDLGAYGLRLSGDPPAAPLLTPVPANAPVVRIVRRVGSSDVQNHVDESRATVPLAGGGGLELDRSRRLGVITTRVAISDDALAHPYLAPIAAVHSHWLGRAAFHAGAVAVNGRAWGVVGEREAGKSTLLAAMAQAGVAVLADDLLVIDGAAVYPGPRTLDLREEIGQRLGSARPLGMVGARERWRLDLGPAPVSAPFAGWIVPSWSETMEVTWQSGAAAIHYIAPARAVTGLAIEPGTFMRASAAPAVLFARPRDMKQLDAGAAVLLRAIA